MSVVSDECLKLKKKDLWRAKNKIKEKLITLSIVLIKDILLEETL